MSIIDRRVGIAICMAVTALSCTASWAQDAAAPCRSVSNVQKQIVERAAEGMDSLRSYVWTTNFVYGIRMVEVRDSLDQWRAAIDCQQKVARADSKVEVAIESTDSDR
jgi:hypothetical protein